VATARGEVKTAQTELARTEELLEATRREAQALGERAGRLEKQLFELIAASKLEKQLLETLGAAQSSGAELGRALNKAESEVWREKTAKDASLLEVRSLREDVKRLQARLAGEMARREELARQWADTAAKAARAEASGDAVPPSGAEELDALARAMALPPEAPASVPAAARSARPRQPSGAVAKRPATPPEEPKKNASWWCSICGRGGTQPATACKHQWVNNEMI
jgi:hypothetical protein